MLYKTSAGLHARVSCDPLEQAFSSVAALPKTATIQPFGATPPAPNELRIFIVPTCADVGEEYCAGSRLRAGCSVARAHLIRKGLL